MSWKKHVLYTQCIWHTDLQPFFHQHAKYCRVLWVRSFMLADITRAQWEGKQTEGEEKRGGRRRGGASMTGERALNYSLQQITRLSQDYPYEPEALTTHTHSLTQSLSLKHTYTQTHTHRSLTHRHVQHTHTAHLEHVALVLGQAGREWHRAMPYGFLCVGGCRGVAHSQQYRDKELVSRLRKKPTCPFD